MCKAFVCLETAARIVEVDELAPLRRHAVQDSPHNSVGIAILVDSEIRVHRSDKAFQLPLVDAVVVLGDSIREVPIRARTDIYAVKFDARADELHAFRAVLAVELLRMQLAAERGKPLANLLHERQSALLIVRHENHIIHKANEVQAALVYDIVIQLVQIVVHRVLPDQMPDCAADAVRLMEETLLVRNVRPAVKRALAIAVLRRITEDAPENHILEQILVIAFVPSLYEIGELFVDDVLTRVRKVAFQIHFDNPSVFRVAARNFVDVGDDAIDCFDSAVADSIVECPVSQFGLQERTDADVYVVMHHAESHFASEDFARTRSLSDKGISGRTEGMVFKLAHQPRQISLPVEFEQHGILTAPLVLASSVVRVYECFLVHTLPNKFTHGTAVNAL